MQSYGKTFGLQRECLIFYSFNRVIWVDGGGRKQFKDRKYIIQVSNKFKKSCMIELNTETQRHRVFLFLHKTSVSLCLCVQYINYICSSSYLKWSECATKKDVSVFKNSLYD